MMNSQVLCFGELLIRYQSESNPFFKEKKATFNAYAGGSEANVAVALVKQGVPVCYLTAIPENPLSRSLVTILSGYGIDTSRIICKGDRIGSYFLFSPNGLTTGDVLYDRKYSSFHQLNRGDILWDEVFAGVDWFHFSALTPAMSEELAALCLQGLKIARAKGITISVDLNYRSKLWQYGKTPNQVMPALVEYADVIMGNIWASHVMLDTRLPDGLNRHSSKELLVSVSEDCAEEIFRRYKNCRHVANTFRFMDHTHHNLFYGTYHTRTETRFSQTRETQQLIDRIGSGDAFMAGLITGIRKEFDAQGIIDLATDAGFQKLFVEGDF